LNIDLWQKGFTNVAVIHEKTKIPDLNLVVSKVYTVYFSKELFDNIKTSMTANSKAGQEKQNKEQNEITKKELSRIE
jgi:hypothetical protein